MRETAASRLRLTLSCATVWMTLLLIASPVLGQSETPPLKDDRAIDPVECLLLLDDVDRLTVENEALAEKLGLLENPPECDDGFPWVWVLGALAAGYVVHDVVN